MKRAALYICYYDVTEPLVQTQVIAYVRELAKQDIEMHLLTFEREHHSIEKQRAIREGMAEAGIRWHALRYHQHPSLLATLYDIALGAIAAMRICRKHDIQLVHARSHVPAAMALILKRILGCRFLFDLRGLLAEEYVDAGHWTEGNLKFRLTKRMERVFFRKADAFVMLTHRIKEELIGSEPALQERAAEIQVIPCCVDIEKFPIDPQQRTAYRQERGWNDRLVVTYVGKVGTWYLPDEMARFFAAAQQRDSRFFFQVLTQSDPAPMQQALEGAGVQPKDYDIRFAPPRELPLILTACDASISFRKGEYSRLAASPTKVAECLAAGLPLVTNAGIGDCDQMLKTHRLGVVIAEHSDKEYRRAADELCALLEGEDGIVAQRCREFAERELSLSKVGRPRYTAVYERLLGIPVSAGASRAAEGTWLENDS
jgi:glycosyltransferase involved in cell wall biosynthesis